MKKLLIILTICCLTVAARAENVVSVTSASGHPQDEVTLNVSLANTDAAVAFQAEIPLGSQLTYVAGSVALNAARITDHTVTAAVVNGTLKIFAYSLTLSPFVGSEGNLLSFSLRLKNEPGDYALDMGSTKLSDATGNALPVTTQNGMVTILSPKLGINTTTIDYGHVPIRSEYTQTASVTNVGNQPLTITSISFSDAVFSCPSFAETTLQAGENASFTFSFAPMVKGAVTATATIVSNSISGNGIVNLVADPFAVNEIHIGNTTGYCDSVVALPISMNNMEGIIGLQIEANLNDALEFVDFTLSNRKTDHVATGIVSGTTLRLMAYSPTGAAFTGDDGEIAIVRFRLHGLYGNYYLNPFKAVLADANGEDVLSAKYQGRVTIRSPRINGNGSLDFGSSPVTETVTREYVVRNNGNAPMRIDQVVFDQADFAVAETFPITVNQYSNTTLHVSYSREQKGDFNALMKIYSNDPQNGLKNVTLSGSRYEPNSVELTAEPFSLDDGDVAVSLSLNNYSDIVALQADFHYPNQDYSIATTDFQLTERFGNHSLYAMPLNDSVYRILVLSLQNQSVDGNEGVVLNATLHPIGTPSEEEYTVSVSNIVLSETEGLNVFTGEEASATFTLMVTQAAALAQGWNWWSTYIEQDGIDGLGMLENSLGHNGVTIKSQNEFTENFYQTVGYDYWYGSLESISNEQGYLVSVEGPCDVAMRGTPAKPANHPITIQPNWNWIGYPVAVPQTVTSALAGFSPAADDVVKGQSDFTSYYEGYGWYPEDFMLIPGQSYLYCSNANANKTLTYANGNRDGSAVSDEKAKTYWQNDIHAFADNLSIMAVVSVDDVEQRDENMELGAFVNGECRGSARLRHFAPLDRYYAMLTVTGQDDDVVEFRLINSQNLETREACTNRVVFKKDDVLGSLCKPYEVRFDDETERTGIMAVYPNPMEKGQAFSLDIPQSEEVVEVVITDVVGNQLRHVTGAVNPKAIKGLPTAGVYVVKAVAKSGNTYYGRLIVE